MSSSASDDRSGATATTRAPLRDALERGLERRGDLLAVLHAEQTDCYRLLHGVAEGAPGLTLDRYGPLLLIQTWRTPLSDNDRATIEDVLAAPLGLVSVWNHRGVGARPRDRARDSGVAGGSQGPSDAPPPMISPYGPWPVSGLPADVEGRELGLRLDVRPRWRGIDPLLFLDLRAGRRHVMAAAKGKSVLNLFAYTCTAGVTAAAGGASEVWNVDFASSALAIGSENAARNGIGAASFVTQCEDVFPVVRQLAGLKVGDWRGGRQRPFKRVAARAFDIVVLDPPARAKSAFGTVDVVRDYPSLFKPAVLATAPGGHILATNHAASVDRDEWLEVLRRCAAKAGRPLRSIDVIVPESDVPSFDGRPPLKLAWCAL